METLFLPPSCRTLLRRAWLRLMTSPSAVAARLLPRRRQCAPRGGDLPSRCIRRRSLRMVQTGAITATLSTGYERLGVGDSHDGDWVYSSGHRPLQKVLVVNGGVAMDQMLAVQTALARGI